eukprot:1038953-Alexandrium_andersonii.AAC.1
MALDIAWRCNVVRGLASRAHPRWRDDGLRRPPIARRTHQAMIRKRTRLTPLVSVLQTWTCKDVSKCKAAS